MLYSFNVQHVQTHVLRYNTLIIHSVLLSQFSFLARLPNKRRIQTRYKLPLLNWATLPATQVAGTVFSQLDDERILQVINFEDFEERFKRHDAVSAVDGNDPRLSVRSEPMKRRKESVLAPNRSQNVAIARKKVTASIDALKQSIAM